jgi:hypothetical protein
MGTKILLHGILFNIPGLPFFDSACSKHGVVSKMFSITSSLPDNGPKCGPKHVAVIKENQCKEFDWFIYNVVSTARIPQNKFLRSKFSCGKLNRPMESSVKRCFVQVFLSLWRVTWLFPGLQLLRVEETLRPRLAPLNPPGVTWAGAFVEW